MAEIGERASYYVYMCVRCLILLAVIETITCKTNYQDGDSKIQSSTNISCLYSEFKTITCTWSLEDYYKNDYNNPLDLEENVHIYYTFNASTSQYCYRDILVNLPCVCLHSGETKCSWSHKCSKASESLSLLVAVNDIVTSKLLSSRGGQFELLDIVKPSPVNNLTVENSTEDGCLLVKWDIVQSYTDYICELTTRSNSQNMTRTYVYLHERPIQVFPMICHLHPNEVTVLEVRCRVMIMQTERGFWSNVSVLPIKSDNKVHDSDTYLANFKIDYVITIVICLAVAMLHLCMLVGLGVLLYIGFVLLFIGKIRLPRQNHIKERMAFERISLDKEYLPIQRQSFLEVSSTTERECLPIQRQSFLEVSSTTERAYTNYTDTYSGKTRVMIGESITSQNATLINNVGKLLDENILPTNKDIQTINKCFGRQSQKMKTLCEQICGVIKRKMYKDTATDIWPAWNPKSDQIVFVVESKKITKISSTSDHTDLEIIEYERNCNAFEKESHMVMEKEKELLTSQTYDDIGRLQSLQKKVSTYSKELMDKHKNITAIFPSNVRSVGYFNSGKHRFIETLCISIRVEKKVSGLIPLEEKLITRYLGTYPTDVIAGDFCFLGDRPNDFHENIKIGSAIHAGLETDKGEMLGGTMGCFVKHKLFGMCCLTSAHIVLSQAEIQQVLKNGYHEYDRNSLKPVFQPISKSLSQFGQIVAAACNEGQSQMPGVEVALIQILCRHPTSGSFPLTDSKRTPTFAFNSGNIADAKLVRPLTEVFKFGIETGSTIGLLGIPGVSVRYRRGLRLENQLVVMPKKDAPFAEHGDSGSPAFIGISCPGTEAAIGLVSGGFDSGQVLVTPIHAALKAVKCPPYLHRFEDADSGLNDDISEGFENMDCS